jgi:Uma2 family endonuclease
VRELLLGSEGVHRRYDKAVYPDVLVVCGKAESRPLDAHAVANPVLIVEVLSDSTEDY